MYLLFRRRCVRAVPWLLGVLVSLVVLEAPAAARLNGLAATGCDGCHTGGRKPTVSLTMDPVRLMGSASATLTVRISATNGNAGGFYLTSTMRNGVFTDIAGQGTRKITETEVVHSSPKTAVNGEVTFQVKWTAPPGQGSAVFEVYVLSANGNRDSGGDAGADTRLASAYGCDGVDVWIDADKDGVGSEVWGVQRACAVMPGLAAKAGDCNDYDANSFPGAPELCNGKDDNCDGKIDEGLSAVTVYRDADGDGHGARFTTDTRVGCVASGYAAVADDCNDNDKTVYPGVKEICNLKDDDCNDRVDDNARARCGKGWCEREAPTCTGEGCTPGTPRKEECNLYDDDCDGVIDNDAPCEGGNVCYLGRCLKPSDAKDLQEAAQMMANTDGGVGGSSGGAGSGGGGSSGGHGGTDEKNDGGSSRPRPKAGVGCALDAGLSTPSMPLGLFALGLAALARARRPRR